MRVQNRLNDKPTANAYERATTQKDSNCGLCGQQNWSPLHNCSAKTWNATIATNWDILHEYAAAKPKNTGKRRINYLEETYDRKKETKPEDIQRRTQISRILPDKNDNYRIKLKIKGR